MPRLFPVCATMAMAAALSFAPAMRGQSAAAQGAGKMPAAGSAQDISGVWLFGGGGDTFDLPRETAPFTPAARAKFNTERNQHGPNVVLDYESNTDPFIRRCDPLGVPRVLLANHPFKMIPLAAEVIVLYERSHDFREIYTDGRDHPKDLDPSWWGHSIGKWDGGTLTVDSVGFNDKTWLDYQGMPHSEALHVTERYRRMSHDDLQLEITIDDPKDYTKAWGVTRDYKLKPWDIGEEICTVESEDHFNSGIVHPAAVPRDK